MITKEKVEQFQNLESEKAELETELRRIDGFLIRPADNRDNARAINQGKIFVKFAGTACMLPTGIFTAELKKRKKECEDRLREVEAEIQAL